MRVLRWILAALVLVATAVAILPFVLSADTVRAHVIAQVEAATGLTVRVDGPVRFSLWPLLDLVAESVTLSRDDELELQAAEIRVGLAVAPLLSGTARITEFAIESPVLVLATGGQDTGLEEPADDDAMSELDGLAHLSVERFSISDGTAILVPRDGGPATRIEAIAAVLAMPAIDRPSRVEARARMGGREFAVDVTLDSPARLLNGQAARATAMLTAHGLLGAPAEVATEILYADHRLRLGDLSAAVGDSRLEGWAEAVFLGTPYLEAELSGPQLDLDTLLPGSDDSGRDAASGAATHIDFSLLSSFAADIDLSIDALRVAGLDFRPARLGVAVDGGRLIARVARVGVAGGALAGSLQVDPNGDVPVMNGTVEASGVDIAALAPLIPEPYGASGRLGADLRFATAGRNAGELRHNANIAGEIAITGATVTGLGLAEAVGEPAADRLDDLAVTVTLTDIREPVHVAGAAAWRGERFELSATGAVAPLLAGERSQVELRVASQRFAAGYRGGIAPSGAADGDVSVETPSLRRLLAWLGRSVDVPAGLERFAISGKLALSASTLSFNDARITLDETTGTGSGRIAFGARPRIEAALSLDRLDVNPYLGMGQNGAATMAGGDSSDAPIDLTGLRAFDADFQLSARTLVYDRIEASNAELAVAVAEGRMAAELRQLSLYGGSGTGRLSVDASGASPTLDARFGLTGLDARPFLIAAADFRRIEGRGDIDLDLRATGRSQRALVSDLGGTANFTFRDGAVRGIDVARIARALSEGVLSGWQSRDEDRTEFYELAANFAIENGNARNDDLRLVGPLVSMTGAGSVAMPARSLDFRVEPRVRANRGEEEVGFGVPVVIMGAWAQPRIYPDIRGILENPAAAYEQLRSLGGGIFRAPAAAEIREQVRERTGVDVEAVTRDGRIDREAVMEEAARGVERLLDRPQRDRQPEAEDDGEPSRPSDQIRGLFRQLIR